MHCYSFICVLVLVVYQNDFVVHGLGGVTINCPGNQVWVLDTDTRMPTCGNTDPSAGNVIFGGCRCPPGLPYLMDDGILCTDSCPPGSSRKCPSNQPFDYANGIQKTCAEPWIGTDFLFEKCGCPYDMLLDIDGQTCVLPEDCPPICPDNQWLNLVDGLPCTKTCDIPDPPCDDFAAKRCECPDSAPFLSSNGVTCLTETECATDNTFTPTEIVPDNDCPGNQVLRIVQTISGFDWPNACCTKTCDDPEAWGCVPLGCFDEELHCACPDHAPILGPDEINCIEEKFCPMRSCFANQQWTPTGRPCDVTCDLDETLVPCDSFNAFRCECAEGTYLSDADGCSCVSCCPELWTRLNLFFGVTDYQLSIKPNPDNLDPQDALINSGSNIQIAHATKYRIYKPELAFRNVKVCFKSRNVWKVKYSFYDGDWNKLFADTDNVAAGSAEHCIESPLQMRRVDLKFRAEDEADLMTVLDIRMEACVPIPM